MLSVEEPLTTIFPLSVAPDVGAEIAMLGFAESELHVLHPAKAGEDPQAMAATAITAASVCARRPLEANISPTPLVERACPL